MPRRATRPFVLLAFALVGCGLGVMGTGALDNTDTDAGPDANTNAGDASNADGTTRADGGAPVNDSSSDDGGLLLDASRQPPPGCINILTDNFFPPDPRWILEGAAAFDGGKAVLVGFQQQQAGGIFFPVEAGTPPTKFDAQFTMIMAADAGPDGGYPPADGVSLVWASDTAQPPLGGTGSGCGFCPNSNSDNVGPTGAALVLHVLTGTGVSIRQSDGITCIEDETPLTYPFTQAPIPVTAVVTPTTVDSGVGLMTYSFDILDPVNIHWIGFTAATGGDVAQFSVAKVVIDICP